MKKNKLNRAELYESAVSKGFYGNEDASLYGKKDNVRKYWEDMYLKMVCRPFVEKHIHLQTRISILDLGCGSGEGFELFTHIPPSDPKTAVDRNFIILPIKIKKYLGIDNDESKIKNGRRNYSGKKNVSFEYAILNEGLPQLILRQPPFDIYYSSYGALSHMSPENLEDLFYQIFSHAANGTAVIFDVYGKFSPAWPVYWNETKEMLPYSNAYLFSEKSEARKNAPWFDVCYWNVENLKKRLKNASVRAGVKLKLEHLADRSIFVGRHMDTGLLSSKAVPLRYQINRLFDIGYRGETKYLKVNLDHLEKYKPSENTLWWDRLHDYKNRWNRVIIFLEALLNHRDQKIKKFIESEDIESLSEDLRLLAWLFKNSDRFQVADFWASVIGPQVAIILRNIEMAYTEAVGCGEGLICGVEIIK